VGSKLGFIVFNVDAATIAARARGLFAAEGLEVEITVTPNSTEQMQGLGNGKWDIASTAFDNVLAWSGREGAEIAAVAQAAAGVVLPVYVRPEIKTWDDLRGKPLAVDAVDTAYALVLRRILLGHGLDLERGDYKLVPAGATGHRLESMKRGETFAGILNAPWDAQAAAAGMARLGDHREALPQYPGGVIAVSRSWARMRENDLKSFLRAWVKGGRWARDPANREEAIRIIAEHEKLNDDAAAGRLKQMPPDGELNLPGLQNVLDLRTRFGFTPPMGNALDKYYDLSYLKAAQS
jgi:ABC-type nitrate/sulfonate/bicarbonate transport system substrate-binding protein